MCDKLRLLSSYGYTLDILPSEKAVEGVSKLLLAPMYLVYEILTGVLPGLLFYALILAKGVHAPTAALASNLLGYKTKLFLAFVFSYLTGRFFRLLPETLFTILVSKYLGNLGKSAEGSAELLNSVLLGPMLVSSLLKGVNLMDVMIVSAASAILTFTSGLVLVVGSVVPGDGYLRVIELVVGSALVLSVALGIGAYTRGFLALVSTAAGFPATLSPLIKLHEALSKLQAAAPHDQKSNQPIATGPGDTNA